MTQSGFFIDFLFLFLSYPVMMGQNYLMSWEIPVPSQEVPVVKVKPTSQKNEEEYEWKDEMV